MQPEQKYLVFNIDQTKSFSTEGGSRIICGYASTWDVDLAEDRILPGAFLSSIQKRFTEPIANGKKSKIRFLFQHDPKEVIGTVKVIKEDAKGLYVECYISRTQRGDELLILLKDGAIDKMSIGYIPLDFKEEGDIRLLKEVDIFEVSIVVFPMNEQTDIFEVRNFDLAKLKKSLSTKRAIQVEATVLDFEMKEFAYRASQIHAEIKAGKVLSNAHKQKLLSALTLVNEVLCAAEPVASKEGMAMCEECGEPVAECTCDRPAKESDSSKPLKEGAFDPVRVENPSNPQTSPVKKADESPKETKDENSSETFSQKEEVTADQNNTLDNTELTDYLKSLVEAVSRIK